MISMRGTLAKHLKKVTLEPEPQEPQPVPTPADEEPVNLFRLVLVYEGEEADIVRDALGEDKASKLVELCRAELEV